MRKTAIALLATGFALASASEHESSQKYGNLLAFKSDPKATLIDTDYLTISYRYSIDARYGTHFFGGDDMMNPDFYQMMYDFGIIGDCGVGFEINIADWFIYGLHTDF
jgi:hypothetical protein